MSQGTVEHRRCWRIMEILNECYWRIQAAVRLCGPLVVFDHEGCDTVEQMLQYRREWVFIACSLEDIIDPRVTEGWDWEEKTQLEIRLLPAAPRIHRAQRGCCCFRATVRVIGLYRHRPPSDKGSMSLVNVSATKGLSGEHITHYTRKVTGISFQSSSDHLLALRQSLDMNTGNWF